VKDIFALRLYTRFIESGEQIGKIVAAVAA
jgi:hypothetical protein